MKKPLLIIAVLASVSITFFVVSQALQARQTQDNLVSEIIEYSETGPGDQIEQLDSAIQAELENMITQSPQSEASDILDIEPLIGHTVSEVIAHVGREPDEIETRTTIETYFYGDAFITRNFSARRRYFTFRDGRVIANITYLFADSEAGARSVLSELDNQIEGFSTDEDGSGRIYYADDIGYVTDVVYEEGFWKLRLIRAMRGT